MNKDISTKTRKLYPILYLNTYENMKKKNERCKGLTFIFV